MINIKFILIPMAKLIFMRFPNNIKICFSLIKKNRIEKKFNETVNDH